MVVARSNSSAVTEYKHSVTMRLPLESYDINEILFIGGDSIVSYTG